MIKVTQTGIADLVVIEPSVHGDHRGWFMETYPAMQNLCQAIVHLILDFLNKCGLSR